MVTNSFLVDLSLKTVHKMMNVPEARLEKALSHCFSLLEENQNKMCRARIPRSKDSQVPEDKVFFFFLSKASRNQAFLLRYLKK